MNHHAESRMLEPAGYAGFPPHLVEWCHIQAKQLSSLKPLPDAWLISGEPQMIERAVGEWRTRGPANEPLLDRLLAHLTYTFGKDWIEAQLDRPVGGQHAVVRWLVSLPDAQRKYAPDLQPGEVVGMIPTGNMMELGWLGEDLYRLRIVDALDSTVLERLRSHDQFQGARYEVAIAASMARSGFAVEWVHARSTKHCEFYATHGLTGETVAVEVKSRHVPGTLNVPGETPNPDGIRFAAHRLYNKAIKQCPTDLPVAIFINLNLPPGSEGDAGIPWKDEIRRMATGIHEAQGGQPAVENFLALTNLAAHYTGDGRAPMRQNVYSYPLTVRQPLLPETIMWMTRGIETYGQIPRIER